MRIGLFLDQLVVGGAERQFLNLAHGLAERGHAVSFYTLYEGGGLAQELQQGARLQHLPLAGRRPAHGSVKLPQALSAFRRRLAMEAPEVLYSAMPVPNLVAALAVQSGRVPLAWGVRGCGLHAGWKQTVARSLCRSVRRRVSLTISNSHAGLEHARRHGLACGDLRVIPNGIQTDRFRADLQAGARMRAELGCRDRELLVGILGRLVPVKGHDLFLRAAALAARQDSRLRFVCVTPTTPRLEGGIAALAAEPSLAGRLLWRAAGSEVRPCLSALDLLVSASRSEGFSNALAEAMCTGVPCVATDVGDSARIVGDTGRITRPGSVEDLAAGILEFAALSQDRRRHLGALARQRVLAEFSMEAMLSRTEAALSCIARKAVHA